MLVTIVTTLGVTAVLSSVITYCVTVMKRRNIQPQPSTAATQEQPVYEDVSMSREDTCNIEMGENIAYGPVVRLN